jgi:hypothetical protein
MGIELKKGENVFFPAPYVPSEPALLLVTDQRIINFGADGREEMETKKISFVGRSSGRPFLVACIIMALIGLPILLYAANEWFGVIGDTAAVKDMKNFSDQTITEDTGGEDPLYTKIKVLAMAAVGAGLCAAAWFLIKKKRYIVTVRGGDQLMKMQVPDEIKQTTVVQIINSLQQAAKAMKDAKEKAVPAPKT